MHRPVIALLHSRIEGDLDLSARLVKQLQALPLTILDAPRGGERRREALVAQVQAAQVALVLITPDLAQDEDVCAALAEASPTAIGPSQLNEAQALLEAIRAGGMLPVGLSYSTSENETLARELGLPLLAKFRDPNPAPVLRAAE